MRDGRRKHRRRQNRQFIDGTGSNNLNRIELKKLEEAAHTKGELLAEVCIGLNAGKLLTLCNFSLFLPATTFKITFHTIKDAV